MSGWPDKDKPGVPMNPERNGRHWLFDPENNKSYPEVWVAEIEAWAVGDAWTARMVAEMGLHYLGPVLTPTEADALKAENARLQAQRDATNALMSARGTNRDYWESVAKKLQAENARLRAALRDVLPHAWAAEYHDDWIGNGVRREACITAEAVLACREVKP